MDVKSKEIIISKEFGRNFADVFNFGKICFGFSQAEKYNITILHIIESLKKFYSFYPECRYLRTKNKIYRNIILDAHIIIYRITEKNIEVLDIIHSASSIRRIQKTRSIKI